MTTTQTRPHHPQTPPKVPRGTLAARELSMSLLAALTTLATVLTIGPAFTDNSWLTGPVLTIGTAFAVGVLWRWRRDRKSVV